ncbi:hypothetical protein FOL47_010087 [Perkinsus chesapeaki]|uniref:Uncharacterized protein n=1 Tax=Perkinsus chesapeaki TaxID=330153 RepID=A0A7J6L4W1_PERCH|nr:hypothetical protein FOL47_010087 [Perkinsus chesapeaki]
MRLSRKLQSEHVRYGGFVKSLSKAVYVESKDDVNILLSARAAAKQTGCPSKRERMEHVRRIIPEGQIIEQNLNRVVKEYMLLDTKALKAWTDQEEQVRRHTLESLPEDSPERSELERQLLERDFGEAPIGSIGWKLLNDRFFECYASQLKHVTNNCLSDPMEEDLAPFVRVGTRLYRGIQGLEVPHYRSLRGSSRCETVHSVLDRTYYSIRSVSGAVFDARLWYLVIRYNRNIMLRLNKDVPPPHLMPRDVLLLGAEDQFRDFRLASADAPRPALGVEYLEGLELVDDGIPDSIACYVKDLIDGRRKEASATAEDIESTEASAADIDFESLLKVSGTELEIFNAMESLSDKSESEVEQEELNFEIPVFRGSGGRRYTHITRASGLEVPRMIVQDSPMEKALEDIIQSVGEHDVELILRTYNCKRHEEIFKAEKEGRNPQLWHATSVHFLEMWLKKRRTVRAAMAPISQGFTDVDDVFRIAKMLDDLEQLGQGAQGATLLAEPPQEPLFPCIQQTPAFEKGPATIPRAEVANKRKAQRHSRKRPRAESQCSRPAQPSTASCAPIISAIASGKELAPARDRMKPAMERVNERILEPIEPNKQEGRKRCSKCHEAVNGNMKYQLKGSDLVHHHVQLLVYYDNVGEPHVYSSALHGDRKRTQLYFCPLCDSLSLADRLEAERKEVKRECYKRGNDIKRMKRE